MLSGTAPNGPWHPPRLLASLSGTAHQRHDSDVHGRSPTAQTIKGGQMADVSAYRPIFSRGSAVLDYWLVHAEGLIVQPIGARVEEVVVVAPVGRAVALIVRSRRTHRRTAIPVESIAAVQPSAGQLLLDVPASRQRLARVSAAGALYRTRSGAVATLSWLRPRAVHACATTAHQSRRAAALTGTGVAWVMPRLAGAVRTAGAAMGQLAAAVAALCARGVARTASELGPVAASGARWLGPRLAASSRTAGKATVRLTLAVAALCARGWRTIR